MAPEALAFEDEDEFVDEPVTNNKRLATDSGESDK